MASVSGTPPWAARNFSGSEPNSFQTFRQLTLASLIGDPDSLHVVITVPHRVRPPVGQRNRRRAAGPHAGADTRAWGPQVSLTDRHDSPPSTAVSLRDHRCHCTGRAQADGPRAWQAARWGASLPTAPNSGFDASQAPFSIADGARGKPSRSAVPTGSTICLVGILHLRPGCGSPVGLVFGSSVLGPDV